MLQLEAVSLAVGGETHIDRVDLALDRGTLNVLLGPTLSGKTSLMRLMAGLDRPTGGRILMDGKDVTGVPVRRRNVAMVYQQFINYPSMSVYENIASPRATGGRYFCLTSSEASGFTICTVPPLRVPCTPSSCGMPPMPKSSAGNFRFCTML